MPTPAEIQAAQDKADAELFRSLVKVIASDKNRGLLMQVGSILPPNLLPPLMKRATEITSGK